MVSASHARGASVQHASNAHAAAAIQRRQCATEGAGRTRVAQFTNRVSKSYALFSSALVVT
jgi:hypothetical protein